MMPQSFFNNIDYKDYNATYSFLTICCIVIFVPHDLDLFRFKHCTCFPNSCETFVRVFFYLSNDFFVSLYREEGISPEHSI